MGPWPAALTGACTTLVVLALLPAPDESAPLSGPDKLIVVLQGSDARYRVEEGELRGPVGSVFLPRPTAPGRGKAVMVTRGTVLGVNTLTMRGRLEALGWRFD